MKFVELKLQYFFVVVRKAVLVSVREDKSIDFYFHMIFKHVIKNIP